MFNLRERAFFYFLILVFIASLLGWAATLYYSKTEPVADYGGEYIEGIVGQPLHINPVLSQSNNADEDLVRTIYSGLLKYGKEGNLEQDLAERYELSEDKTLYTFHLKKGVLWHDGQPLTASDVLFTINLLEDPVYKSPLRVNWQGIEADIQGEYTITFKIKTPYVGFPNNLTFGILPKHIWESVSPENFSLTELNLKPIGAGPYKYSTFQKDSKGNIISYKLVSNPNYHAEKPYISKLTFHFYPDDESILAAYNTKEIMGINNISPQKIRDIKIEQSASIHKFSTPRYFAVFINQTKSFALANDEVRKSLAYATNRDEIITQVLGGNGTPVQAPFFKNMTGYTEELEQYEFNLEKANQILDEHGWTRGEDGYRAKNGKALEFTLITTDWAELVKTADLLKFQWEKTGVKVRVDSFSISDIQQNYIRPREYEALLFGQVLGSDPDPYSFWHGSQKKDPGLNLSLFGDNDTDKLIDDGRAEFDAATRASLYIDFQKKLHNELPAIFLYSPDYVYPVTKKVRGIEITTLISPAQRFHNINSWYVKTKRVWKQ